MADVRSTASPRPARSLPTWQVQSVASYAERLTVEHMPRLDRAEFAILAVLADEGPRTLADLSRTVRLRQEDLTDAIARLERATCLIRRVDPADRRRQSIRLTSSGLRRLASLQAVMDRVQERFLQGLTAAERAQLEGLHLKLLAAQTAQRPPAP